MNQTELPPKSSDIETVFKSGKTFSISLRKLEEKIKYILGKASKKNRFFLGKSPKLWVGGGQES